MFVYKVSFGHFEGRTFIGNESPKLRSRDLKLKPAAGVFIYLALQDAFGEKSASFVCPSA